MKIQFEIKKLYYKYINTSSVNHYRLLLLTEEYEQIGKYYFSTFQNDYNTNTNKKFIEAEKRQKIIKKEFFENREIICKKEENKDCKLCSDYFIDFYVNRPYHYGQCIDFVLKDIRNDIKKLKN